MNQGLQAAWDRRKIYYAEGSKLWVEGDKLYAEGNKLYAEGSKLYAEGDKLWVDAVIAVYGDVPIKWDGDKCVLNILEIYE